MVTKKHLDVRLNTHTLLFLTLSFVARHPYISWIFHTLISAFPILGWPPLYLMGAPSPDLWRGRIKTGFLFSTMVLEQTLFCKTHHFSDLAYCSAGKTSLIQHQHVIVLEARGQAVVRAAFFCSLSPRLTVPHPLHTVFFLCVHLIISPEEAGLKGPLTSFNFSVLFKDLHPNKMTFRGAGS